MISQEEALKKLADRMKQLRQEKSITLEKLAYENDISKGNLSDIENCKRYPSLITLIKIANGLDCKVSFLIEF